MIDDEGIALGLRGLEQEVAHEAEHRALIVSIERLSGCVMLLFQEHNVMLRY